MEDLVKLKDEGVFGSHAVASEAIEDLRIMFEYLKAMGKLDKISFDLSLARGLDYYTGVIYEAVCIEAGSQVGSIGGGGRYDGLAGMFSGDDIPCVGVSVGIERVFTLVEKNMKSKGLPPVDVVIAGTTMNEVALTRKMEVAKHLWKGGVRAEISAKKLKQAIQADVLDRGVKYMVVVGDKEWDDGEVIVKVIEDKKEVKCGLGEVVEVLKGKGCGTVVGGGEGGEEKGKKIKKAFAWTEKDLIR